MTSWFAAPLAIIFALATLSGQPEKSSASDKSEKDKSEQTDKSVQKGKSGKDESRSGVASKGKRHH